MSTTASPRARRARRRGPPDDRSCARGGAAAGAGRARRARAARARSRRSSRRRRGRSRTSPSAASVAVSRRWSSSSVPSSLKTGATTESTGSQLHRVPEEQVARECVRDDRGDGVLFEGGECDGPDCVPRTEEARRQAERGRREREVRASVDARRPAGGRRRRRGTPRRRRPPRSRCVSPSCVSQCTPPSRRSLVRAGRRGVDPCGAEERSRERGDGDGRCDKAEPPAGADVETPLRELERNEDRRNGLNAGRERPQCAPSALAPAATAASTSSIITRRCAPPPAKWSARSGLQPRNATAAAFRVRSATRTIEARSAATASARYASSARARQVPAASAGTVPTATKAGPYGVGSARHDSEMWVNAGSAGSRPASPGRGSRDEP